MSSSESDPTSASETLITNKPICFNYCYPNQPIRKANLVAGKSSEGIVQSELQTPFLQPPTDQRECGGVSGAP